MAKCVICGHEAKSLQPHLKYVHNLTVKEYRSQYGNATVYDYNPADNIWNWAKTHRDEYDAKHRESRILNCIKMNDFLSEHPDLRIEIARLGGKAVNGQNLKSWKENTAPEIVSAYCAKAGHLSSISKGHEYMARVALENNRYCKYFYESKKFNISRKFASKWEVNFIKLCEASEFITMLVHEPFGIDYMIDNKCHKYYPDFLVNDNVLAEIKPYGKLNDKDVVLKSRVAEDFCKNTQYRYIIITERSLYSLRSGEITKSAQQKLLDLLKI